MNTETKAKHTPGPWSIYDIRAVPAAAPDLLAACKALVAEIEASDCQEVFGADYLTALAAIRRAEGAA